MNEVRPSSRFAAFLSGLALQAGYNYEGFQHIGFAACLLPALRDLYPDPADQAEAVARHLEFFNANPYLAPFAVGALMRMEQQLATGTDGTVTVQGTSRIKRALGSMLGGMGDRFLWAGLLPLSIAAAMMAFFIEPLWGALTLLLLFNLAQLIMRAEGQRVGFRLGARAAPVLAGEVGVKAVRWVQRFAALLIGLLLPVVVAHPQTPAFPLSAGLVAAGAGLMMLAGTRRLYRVFSLLLLTALVSLYALLT
jgi:mannose/fructose/N-acetylgalactosamine-specific phosphotransferase system component IID